MKKQSNLAVFFGKVAHNCTEEIIHDLPREFEHYFDCIACFNRDILLISCRSHGHGWELMEHITGETDSGGLGLWNKCYLY